MKLFVSRNESKIFQKGKIEFNDAMELILLIDGLELKLEKTNENIKLYESDKEKDKCYYDCALSLEVALKRKYVIECMIENLRNQIEWK